MYRVDMSCIQRIHEFYNAGGVNVITDGFIPVMSLYELAHACLTHPNIGHHGINAVAVFKDACRIRYCLFFYEICDNRGSGTFFFPVIIVGCCVSHLGWWVPWRLLL